MRNPKVFIILVNWNGIDDTEECLESIKPVNYRNYEVVLVDNGSKDNQAEVIKQKYPSIHVLKNKTNTGFVVANNQGIEFARENNADYYLLLNNDTVVDPDFLNILIDYAEKNHDTGILSPKILYYKSNKIWSMGGKISYLTGISIMIGKGKNSSLFNKVISPDFLTGCAMLIKKEVIEKIGLLDPIYFAYYEDVDYCYRAREKGFRLKTIPKSEVAHKKSASSGITGSDKICPLQAYYWGRNSLIFAYKNLSFFRRKYFIFTKLSIYVVFIIARATGCNSVFNYFKGVIDGFRVASLLRRG